MNARILSVASLAAVCALSVQVQAEPWITHFGMTGQGYQDFYDNELPNGYRPIAVSVNGTNVNPRFSGVWVNDGVAPGNWAARHGLTAAEYQTELEDLLDLGFRVISVDATGTGADPRFTAVWVNDGVGAGDWDTRYGLTSAEYNGWTNDLWNQGIVPIWVQGYGDPGDIRFAAAYRRNFEGWSYAARHNMTVAEYQDEIEDKVADGFRLICSSAYGDEDNPTFAAIWVLPDGNNWEIQPKWIARHGDEGSDLQDDIDDLGSTYYQPVCIEEYGPSNDPRFAHVWVEDVPAPVFSANGASAHASLDDAVKSFMIDRKISRGALAVTVNGKLVHNRAYTYMHPSAPDTQTDTRFRLASCSKPLTGIGIQKLIELNPGITLNSRLVDILPAADTIPWMDDVPFGRVTIRHLLNHTAGWDDAAPGGHTYEFPLGVFNNINALDPMYSDFTITNTLGTALPLSDNEIMTFMQRVYFDTFPGTAYAYSNFGYFLAGRVIEVVSGQTYEQFMRDNVFCPVGAGLIAAGSTAADDALPDESNYRDAFNRLRTTRLDESGDIVPLPYGGGFNVEVRTPNGGWVASAQELARVLNAFTNPAASPILTQASINQMWTGSAANSGYGLGWILNSDKQWHNGSYNGTRTHVCRRDDGITFNILFNQTAPGNTPVAGLDGDIFNDLNDAIDAIQAMAPIGGAPPWPTWDLFGPGTCGHTAPCPGDLNGDGQIGSADLATLLSLWGFNPGSPADLNGDTFVNAADLANLLALWGRCR